MSSVDHICIFLFFLAPFSLDADSGQLVTTGVLDRELVAKYHLDIMCADHGHPRLSSTATLTVHVQDMNDHSPEFQQALYTVQLLERTPIGSVILYALATDLDSGLNAVVTYDLHGTGERFFSINAYTGLVTVARSIRLSDLRRNETTLELTIQATDGGRPPRTNEAVLLVSGLFYLIWRFEVFSSNFITKIARWLLPQPSDIVQSTMGELR